MPTVWLLVFSNWNTHLSDTAAVFSTRAACIATARSEESAANPQANTGRHFACEEFVISSEAGLDCEPYLSKPCEMKSAQRPVVIPENQKK